MTARTADVPGIVRHLEPFLIDWIETQRRRSGVPGVQVAIRIGDELLFSHAAGVADASTGEPLTTGHGFRIASHSKTFTATAIMQLVERGELGLNDTVGRWVPELAEAPVGASTVRELLGHQSGAERDGLDANWWQLRRDFPTRDELVDELRRGRVLPANTRFHYSNLAYSLLGVIVEQVTGRDYRAVAQELTAALADVMREPVVIGPDLGVGPDVPQASGHAVPTGLRIDGDEWTPPVIAPVDTRAQTAATGFWANAETASAWLAAHALGTGAFLTDETKRLMQRRESEITKAGVTRWYGLGWISRRIGDRFVIGHSGGFPGHITQTWGDPASGLAVSVLTNRVDGAASEWASAVVALIDRAASAADFHADVVAADAGGRFQTLWGETGVVPLPGAVLRLSHDVADPASGAVVLRADADGALRAEQEDGFGDAGEIMQLHRDADGAVTSITVTGITAHRPEAFGTIRGRMLRGEY